jgi:hypothetical protein
MNMPCERTRALRWAGEFLREVSASPECSKALRRQAVVILRHYPDTDEIAHQAQHGGTGLNDAAWLEREKKYEKQ